MIVVFGVSSISQEVGSVSRAGAAEGGGRQRKGTASLATPVMACLSVQGYRQGSWGTRGGGANKSFKT